MLTGYQIIYLVTSLFGVYTIYEFMRLFYDNQISSKWLEIISYLVYFLSIAVIYFVVNIPLVLAITNVVAFIGLSFNYKTSFRKSLISAIYIFLTLMAIELIVGVVSGYFGLSVFEHNEFDNSFSLIVVRILSYMIVLLLGRFKNIKLGHKISLWNWVTVIGIPLISLYLIIIVFQSELLLTTQVVMGITSLFVINILVFYLYDTLQLQAGKEIERKLLLQQNKYYNNQFLLMQSSEKAIRAIRHDWKNHLSVLATLMKKKDHLNANRYLQEIIKVSETTYRYVNTGNIEFDSILNFKLQEASNKGIPVNIDIKIPEVLKMNSYDITTILGNLLDNAIEATEHIKGKRIINIDIRYTKGRLLIETCNPIDRELILEEGLPITTKSEKQDHGIGLKQVKKVLEKYNGDMEITIDKNVFKIFIFIYSEQR